MNTQNSEQQVKHGIFPFGEKNERYADVFVGQSYLAGLAAAPDAQCTIQLDITDTHAELLVINPLANHHHDQQLSSGLGLLSIQERTHALGGTTTITPTDHQWILHTTLPLTPKDTP